MANKQEAKNIQDIKPGKEKLLQVNQGKKDSEFKQDAVTRKYSKEPAPAVKDSDKQESFREDEKIENNEGL